MTGKTARTSSQPPQPKPLRPATRLALLAGLALAAASATASGTAGVALARGTQPVADVIAPSSAESQALPVCSAPLPGHASCLAYELAPQPGSAPAARLSSSARAHLLARERANSAALAPAGRASAPLARLAEGAALGTPDTEPPQEPQPVTPADLHSAYELPDQSAEGSPQQTIALVDAYNDPHAEADLATFDSHFGLPECTTADGCFKQVNQDGETANLPFPSSEAALAAQEAICKRSRTRDETRTEREERETACREVEEAVGWGVEISTDIEVAHSVCQNCQIRLVEAATAEYSDLEAAERTAARPVAEGGEGASEISNSWGGEAPPSDSTAFEHPGIVVTASAGDLGYLNWTEAETAAADKRSYYSGADYPASSPHVVAVGGTKLTLTAGGARASETVWNEDPDPEGKNSGAGGGGCATSFKAPAWQSAVPDWPSVGCGTGSESKRAVADVAADGDPYSGVLVYDSGESKSYLLEIGGTSVASPIIAATFALAGGAHEVRYPAATLYSHLGSSSLYDVTSGGNGQCDDVYTAGCSGSMEPLSSTDCGAGVLICNAAAGYDGPTGVGTPNGIAAFQPGSEAIQRAEEKRRAEEKLREEEKLRAEAKLREEEELREEARAALEQDKETALGEATQPGADQQPAGSAPGTTGSATAGAGENSQKAATGGSGGAATGTGAKSSGSAAPTIRISNLALTANAIAAFRRGEAAISRVAFAFTLNAAAQLHATLTRQVRTDGRLRWVPEPDALPLAGHRGRNRFHLHGSAALAPGVYRLTLTPAHGRGRSLTFVLR
jgi:hypothetical protein